GLGLGAAQASTVEPPFTSFVVFGDSLSDPGNLFAATSADPGLPPTPASPPYFEGRFSNGPVWAETVDDNFGVTANFAFGGAQAASDDDGVPDFADQIDLFRASPVSGALGDRPLASIWLGANDLFGAFGKVAEEGILAPVTGPLIIGEALLDAGTGLSEGVGELRAAGIEDFLFFNLPDLGATPAFADLGVLATAPTDTFNFGLDLFLAGPDLADANVTLIDINALFDDLIANPADFGVSDVTTPCVIPDLGIACTPENALERAFFDPVHPNSIVHAAIASEVEDALGLAPAPVPLPAGLPLLLVGLGALGLLRRRVAV
ncbi:MAG: SGNH/GDSL hydrolase family protein, partial [Pseudomonadota bacterium]